MASISHSRTKVCYFYDNTIGNYYFGQGHPMKPHRIRMTHNLLDNYGLYRKMEIYCPPKATDNELTRFHSDDYIRFLRSIRPDSIADKKMEEQFNINVDGDCPAFDGLYEFCQLSAGGSVAGAVNLNKKTADIAINWAGGLHHAKKRKAAGFCYVNDIVLAILELLKYHQRVIYVDIDIHHGDGVEEAFMTTDRVMTVSFHKYGKEFFPGTGHVGHIGLGEGKYYSVNVPLKDGIDDDSFESIFKEIMTKVMESYQPAAVVLQCGADSLAGDYLGSFNLTVKGHANCVEFVKKYNLPLLLLGGGGYTIQNVARCWTYETAVALGTDIPNELPDNDYFEYFKPDYKLHISAGKMINQNTPNYLNKIKRNLMENLRNLPCAPGVQMQAIPEDGITVEDPEEEEKQNPDERISIRASDKRVAKDNEFSDSEDEGEGRRNQRPAVKVLQSVELSRKPRKVVKKTRKPEPTVAEPVKRQKKVKVERCFLCKEPQMGAQFGEEEKETFKKFLKSVLSLSPEDLKLNGSEVICPGCLENVEVVRGEGEALEKIKGKIKNLESRLVYELNELGMAGRFMTLRLQKFRQKANRKAAEDPVESRKSGVERSVRQAIRNATKDIKDLQENSKEKMAFIERGWKSSVPAKSDWTIDVITIDEEDDDLEVIQPNVEHAALEDEIEICQVQPGEGELEEDVTPEDGTSEAALTSNTEVLDINEDGEEQTSSLNQRKRPKIIVGQLRNVNTGETKIASMPVSVHRPYPNKSSLLPPRPPVIRLGEGVTAERMDSPLSSNQTRSTLNFALNPTTTTRVESNRYYETVYDDDLLAWGH